MAIDDPVQCVILPQFQGNLLLPRASVVEVVNGRDMDIVVDLQGGVIGKMQWRGWTVPLVSFEAASGGSIPKFNSETKSVILHSLADDGTRPYIALTLQGNPKTVEVQESQLKVVPSTDSNDFVQSKVWINAELEAIIPDLSMLVTYTSQYI